MNQTTIATEGILKHVIIVVSSSAAIKVLNLELFLHSSSTSISLILIKRERGAELCCKQQNANILQVLSSKRTVAFSSVSF